jgi:hypothetical protein
MFSGKICARKLKGILSVIAVSILEDISTKIILYSQRLLLIPLSNFRKLAKKEVVRHTQKLCPREIGKLTSVQAGLWD